MERVSLYEELRLIERNECEVSGIWKGAHLLLFFLAFVFGSFCTFCFHMLMYLFDEKCVLFPKLLSLTSLRHNIIYEFIPEDKERAETLPVDFLSTQWVEKSACYLPTYVPLVSGIFGLVWTTMFLMCSAGGRSHSGLQRSWRVIPPVLIFSIAMSGLCVYSSTVTHKGLQELCDKLGEITGSSTCSYTVNVATLAYERQIKGVYQATQLTITSAWMHTGCWLASAALAIARILLSVDFRLVKIRVELIGDIEKMLERNEQHLQTVMPSMWPDDEELTSQASVNSTQIVFRNEEYDKVNESGNLADTGSEILFISQQPDHESALSLLPEERNRLAKMRAFKTVEKDQKFLVNIVYDLIDKVVNAMSESSSSSSHSIASTEPQSKSRMVVRQHGQQTLYSNEEYSSDTTYKTIDSRDATDVKKDIKQQLQKRSNVPLKHDSSHVIPSSSKNKGRILYEPSTVSLYKSKEIDSKQSEHIKKKSVLKVNARNIGIQTEKKNKKRNKKFKVTISESKSTYYEKYDDGSNKNSESRTLEQKYFKDEAIKKNDSQSDNLRKKDPENDNLEPKDVDIIDSVKYAAKKDSQKKDSEKTEPDKKDPKENDSDKKDKDFRTKEKQD